MAFYGLDCHKKFIQIANIAKPSVKADKSYSISTDRASITSFARSLSSRDKIILENTGSANSIATLLKKNSKAKITISNPMATKIITSSKKKTDRNDALALANLHAVDYVPTVWQPSADIVALRRLVGYYCSIKKQKVLVKNRVHGILQRNLVSDIPFYNIFTQKGRRHLLKVELPPDEKQQVVEELGLLAEVEKNMLAITKRIAVRAINDTDIRRLLTITGVNMLTAVTIKSAVGNIERFPHPKKLVGYFGLGTSIYQSADSCFYGRITKCGNKHVRSALVQSAQICVKFPSPLRAFFQRLYQKKGRNKSIIAVASKLTRIIWHMLTNDEDYRYENKALTRIKMLKLNSLAGVVSKRAKRITDVGCGKKAEKEYRARVRRKR